MKKAILSATLVLMTISAAFAQTTKGTVMSMDHAFDYGIAYGNGADHLGNFGNAILDYNFNNSNLRLRGQAGLMEVVSKPCPAIGVDAQYLFKTVGNLYVYPTVGLYAEYHNTDTWKKQSSDETKKWGAGLQAGAGLEYQFSPKFGIFAEARQQFLGNVHSRLTFDLGVICHLGKGARAAEAVTPAASQDDMAAAEAAAKAAADKALAEKAAADKAAAEKAAADKAAAAKAAAEKAQTVDNSKERAKVENIFFDLNKSDIRESERIKIVRIIGIMSQYPDATITLSGYADKETGNAKSNLELSQKRVNVVKAALVGAGISADRISADSLGDTVQPFDQEELNRAVVIVTK